MDFLTDVFSLFLSEKELFNLLLLVSAGASVVFASGYKLYTKISSDQGGKMVPRFPIKVNCWFCNKYSDVKFSRRNSWDCPFCEQYNGFLPLLFILLIHDGNYNKIIPEQSDELLNHTMVTAKRGPYISSDNGLCRKCNINQELKIQQLASFTPIDSARYDEEIELYRQRLERAYQLCPECDCKTQLLLGRIGRWVTEKYGSMEKKLTFRNNKVFIHWHENHVQKINYFLAAYENCTSVLSQYFKTTLKFIYSWIVKQLYLNLENVDEKLPPPHPQMPYRYEILSCFSLSIQTHNNKVVIIICVKIEFSACNNIWIFVSTEETLLNSKMNNTSAPLLPDIPSTVNQAFDYQSDPLELQTGLDSLTLGPMNSSKPSTPSIFEHRVYQPRSYSDIYSNTTFDENFPGPLRKRKSVLKPAKLQLTHSSWVAGGYWQQNHVFPSSAMPSKSIYSNPNMYPFPCAPISRSSSQSSGFVSNVGTNFSSLPNSRSGSVCDADRYSVMSEPVYPSYSPPIYCYLATSPPPGTTLVFPTHTPPSPTLALTTEHISSYSSNVSGHSILDSSTLEARQKPLVSVL
ncbi:hypothetical protein B566_EDAN014418 [Ephemera danica]|nr:hypothetical protein B566_EDAN014418 [Ephemera danica]